MAVVAQTAVADGHFLDVLSPFDYGLIATEISSGGDRKGTELEQEMQGLIEAAIASRVPAP